MIQLQGVSYAYPDCPLPALREIDLAVPDGQWLLLAGPSGGGKSTLLYLLNGLIPHVLGGEIRGDVHVDGLVPANVALRELSRRVGTVFQNPEAQLFMLRVHEDVAFGCENLGLPPAETHSRVEQRPQSAFSCRSAGSGSVQPLGRSETAASYCRRVGDGLPHSSLGRADQRP